MINYKFMKYLLISSLLSVVTVISLACSSEVETVVETVIVEKEVVKEVEKVVEKVVVATPDPSAQTAAPGAQTGVLGVAVPNVNAASGLPRDCGACSTIVTASVQDTLLLSVNGADGAPSFGVNLAESWEYNADGGYTDFKIREGVQFHHGFGELTAEDVAWTFNQGNAALTEGAVHDTIGDAAPHLASVEAHSGNIARFIWSNYVTFAHHKFLSDYHEGIGIFPKAAADENGEEWMRENVVGTGSFEMTEWTTGKGIFLKAVPNHWRTTANVAEVNIFEVKEASTRRAMLETEEVHIAEIAFKDWPSVLEDSRFSKGKNGYSQGGSFVMGGNYWETEHPKSGAKLDPYNLKPELPWVGDPTDEASMESARKVRHALSMTIDREAINDSLLGGLGAVQHLGPISTSNYLYKSDWDVAFDPDGAKVMLAEAGYPDGFDNLAFYIRDGTFAEVAKAVAADWDKYLNVKTALDERAYGVFRPERIDRNSHQLSTFGACCSIPPTWAEEWLVSAVGRPEDGSAGGFNSGMEIPEASAVLIAKGEAGSLAEVEALATDYIQYLSDQALWPGIYETPFNSIYNSDKVQSWVTGPFANNSLGGARHLETIVLVD